MTTIITGDCNARCDCDLCGLWVWTENWGVREDERERGPGTRPVPALLRPYTTRGRGVAGGNHNDHSVMMINIDPQISHFCHKTKWIVLVMMNMGMNLMIICSSGLRYEYNPVCVECLTLLITPASTWPSLARKKRIKGSEGSVMGHVRLGASFLLPYPPHRHQAQNTTARGGEEIDIWDFVSIHHFSSAYKSFIQAFEISFFLLVG